MPLKRYPVPPNSEAGKILSQLAPIRRRKGYTQQALAEATKFNLRTIQIWETLKYAPSVERLCVVLAVFGYTIKIVRIEADENTQDA